ncbi:polysaccharide biosynthesis/export family protein [Photobacterium lipolyticum]|uniref:Capsular biosynthesis protein n=1 Tax=Photobacterium lipolyticum TaxID=266810 RepID=A0A2T3MV30_9GAMM|nr:polysaccharide biosynthesis/export family protein [Photobacterium lipolyticum]PSW03723.1 capsular biosynthesis protein [Photobacterium lipolyticum]
MKYYDRFFILGIVLITLLSSLQAFGQGRGDDSYILGSGDRIAISVFGEDDLSTDVVIPDTGKIKYPFIGELQVAGLTIFELDKRITQRLKGPYFVNPEVIVSIKEYRPFYVHGEVNAPGGFQYRPGLSVQHAVALAGGFTNRAARDKITIVRAGKQGNKYNSVPVKLNDSVKAGDLITVERSFF